MHRKEYKRGTNVNSESQSEMDFISLKGKMDPRKKAAIDKRKKIKDLHMPKHIQNNIDIYII